MKRALDVIDLALRPHLELEGGDSVEVPLDAELVIGRDPGCALRIEDDERVSRRHARVWRQEHRCWIEDLGSHNGTFVNEERVGEPRQLEDRDQIRVCSSRLLFVLDPASGEPPEIVGRLDPAQDPLPGRLQSLLAISEAVATLEDERAIARRVLQAVLPAVRGERGLVLSLDPAGQLHPLAALLAVGREDPDPPLSRTVLRMVLDERLALLTRDARSDERLRKPAGKGPVSSILSKRVSSLCCVPLLVHGRTLGILQVTSAEAESFGAEELALLTGAARVAALAFETARVQAERTRVIAELTETQLDLRVRVEQFRLLYRLEHQLSTTQDVPWFLSSVARQAVAALEASAGSIFLVDELTGRIRFAYPAGGKEREVLHQTFEAGRGSSLTVGPLAGVTVVGPSGWAQSDCCR